MVLVSHYSTDSSFDADWFVSWLRYWSRTALAPGTRRGRPPSKNCTFPIFGGKLRYILDTALRVQGMARDFLPHDVLRSNVRGDGQVAEGIGKNGMIRRCNCGIVVG